MAPAQSAAEMAFAAEVAAYLADCAQFSAVLAPRYHPAEDGAVKSVFHCRHRDPAADQSAEDQIRAAFRALAPRHARRSRASAPTDPGPDLFRGPDPE